MTQLYHSLPYVQRTQHHIPQILAQPCALLLYFTMANNRNNLKVLQLMKDRFCCILLSYKNMNEITQMQMISTCSILFVDPIS